MNLPGTPTARFILTAGVGFLTTILYGASLLRKPSATPHRFAGWIAGIWSLTLFLAIVLSARFTSDSIAVGITIALVNFGVSCPIAFFWFQKRRATH